MRIERDYSVDFHLNSGVISLQNSEIEQPADTHYCLPASLAHGNTPIPTGFVVCKLILQTLGWDISEHPVESIL